MTDDELVRDARYGSGQAFEALFERYRGPVWQFFRRRVPEAAHAEENLGKHRSDRLNKLDNDATRKKPEEKKEEN